MKSVQSPFVAVLATLGLSAHPWASVGAAQESARAANSLAQQVAELEILWKPGRGTDEFEYYVRAGQIADNLFRHEPIAANAAAAELLSNLLAKRRDSLEVRGADFVVGAADLGAMAKAARYLLAEGNVPNGPPLQRIGLFAKLLGTIRAEIVPDYVPKPVFANVMPPVGAPGQGMVAGMDPDAIADPAAREKYKAAIRENSLNNLTNKRQEALHEIEAEFAKRIVDYMSRVAAAEDASSYIVRQAIEDARLTDSEKDEVMRALPR